jgi:ATP-binding cassette subfamily B protein
MQIQGEQKIATAPLSKRRIGQIEFARVSFRYSMNSDPAAIGLDFKISSGEMIAISGSNGSGKSTVLRLILGMYQPQAGAILIDGVDIRQIAPAQLRRMIGYVSQEMQFFKMSIIQNLYLAKPDATETEIYQALDLADALAQVLALPGGLNYRAGENLAELSTSLRQKISLARCYLTKAPILLFDEPALGLGEIGERKFEEILKDLKGKRTVVINTQKMSQILLADTLIVLDKGYLKAAGAPSELLKNPVASK